jgi:hypothetical protein
MNCRELLANFENLCGIHTEGTECLRSNGFNVMASNKLVLGSDLEIQGQTVQQVK